MLPTDYIHSSLHPVKTRDKAQTCWALSQKQGRALWGARTRFRGGAPSSSRMNGYWQFPVILLEGRTRVKKTSLLLSPPPLLAASYRQKKPRRPGLPDAGRPGLRTVFQRPGLQRPGLPAVRRPGLRGAEWDREFFKSKFLYSPLSHQPIPSPITTIQSLCAPAQMLKSFLFQNFWALCAGVRAQNLWGKNCNRQRWRGSLCKGSE